MTGKTFRLAAPSCVIADRVGPNCRVLAGRVDEVGLMFLETAGCLAYDQRDLPLDLPSLGLSFHVHLPLDLPWDGGAAGVSATILALEEKIAFLRPRHYVLHPLGAAQLEALLSLRPEISARLCLENTRQDDLAALWPEITDLDLGVCLDLGHLVSYRQEHILDLPGIFERTRILHVYGAENSLGHLGLDCLPDPSLLHDILARLGRGCALVVEVFDLPSLENSLMLLKSWLSEWGMDHG